MIEYVFFKKTWSDVATAFNRSSIKEFILSSSTKDLDPLRAPMCGKLLKIDNDFIHVRIANASYNMARELCGTTSFDLKFRVNSTPFQVQHNALNWINKHRLYSKLIQNPKFQNTRDAIQFHKYEFNGKTTDYLNEEQQSAVENIIRLNSDSVPYLIFGPPGLCLINSLI